MCDRGAGRNPRKFGSFGELGVGCDHAHAPTLKLAAHNLAKRAVKAVEVLLFANAGAVRRIDDNKAGRPVRALKFIKRRWGESTQVVDTRALCVVRREPDNIDVAV